jgi:ribosome-associated protein
MRTIAASTIKDELTFTTSRSGGPGGQLVNKVSSKVMLRWDIANSSKLNLEEKQILLQKLKSRLVQDGVLLIVSQESRSQHDNKQAAIDKLNELLKKAFEKKKSRKATKKTKSSQEKRLTEKKKASEKKEWRRKEF